MRARWLIQLPMVLSQSAPAVVIESANAVFGQMMGCELTNIIERDIKMFIPGFLIEGVAALARQSQAWPGPDPGLLAPCAS